MHCIALWYRSRPAQLVAERSDGNRLDDDEMMSLRCELRLANERLLQTEHHLRSVLKIRSERETVQVGGDEYESYM